MLVHDGNTELPHEEFLVVAGGDEFAGLDEGYGVDCAEMLVVLEDALAGGHVELGDLLVGGAHEEEVLLVVLGVEFYAEGVLLELEGADYFAVLGVPIVDGFVEACRKEVFAVIGKC